MEAIDWKRDNFEIAVIVRKLGITVIAVTVQDAFMQEYAGSILMIFALAFHLMVCPMREYGRG